MHTTAAITHPTALAFTDCDDHTAETVGQKLNTKNLVQLKVAEQLSRNDSLFRAQAMLSYAGRHSWEPVRICVVAAQNEEAGAPRSAALHSESGW